MQTDASSDTRVSAGTAPRVDRGPDAAASVTPACPSRRPLRVAVALSNPDHERVVLPALHDAGDTEVVARCLDAVELAACLAAGGVDAVLLSSDLHRLEGETLRAIRSAGLPVVAVGARDGSGLSGESDAAAADGGAWAAVVPADAGADAVCQALRLVTGQMPAAIRTSADEAIAPIADGGAAPPAAAVEPVAEIAPPAAAPAARYLYNTTVRKPMHGVLPDPTGTEDVAPASPGAATASAAASVAVVALAGGAGSPGRTAVAVNLAVALGAVAPTVLVDLDLSGPAVAAHLDLDPTRNVYMLAHADPQTAGEWDRALRQELRPLGARSPHGAVLCGVPKPEMRAGVTARFVNQLLAELRQRYRYVVVDTGAELLAPELAVHRAALAEADQVLLVAAADLVGLAQARTALPVIRAAAGTAGTPRTAGTAGTKVGSGARRSDQVALLINRHDRRFHHGRREIEWALGLGTAAVIPHDHAAAQRAIAAQRPLVFDPRSRAARALLELAGRLHDGRVVLPPEPDAPRTVAGRLREAVRRRGAALGVLRPRAVAAATAPTGSGAAFSVAAGAADE